MLPQTLVPSMMISLSSLYTFNMWTNVNIQMIAIHHVCIHYRVLFWRFILNTYKSTPSILSKPKCSLYSKLHSVRNGWISSINLVNNAPSGKKIHFSFEFWQELHHVIWYMFNGNLLKWTESDSKSSESINRTYYHLLKMCRYKSLFHVDAPRWFHCKIGPMTITSFFNGYNSVTNTSNRMIPIRWFISFKWKSFMGIMIVSIYR